MMPPIIVIDAGHGGSEHRGGSTPIGVVGPNGLCEKDVTIAVARRAAEYIGPRAILTRNSDVNLSLAERAHIAGRHGAEIFISIHANGGGPGSRGSETYVHQRAGERSIALARAIDRALAPFTPSPHGVYHGDLALLAPEHFARETSACLVELDYLSDPEGERRFSEHHAIDGFAQAIASTARRFGDGSIGVDNASPPAYRNRRPQHNVDNRGVERNSESFENNEIFFEFVAFGAEPNDAPPDLPIDATITVRLFDGASPAQEIPGAVGSVRLHDTNRGYVHFTGWGRRPSDPLTYVTYEVSVVNHVAIERSIYFHMWTWI
jgi:hypothetical protein